MKQRILNHASILVVVSVLVTFIAASSVLYERYAANMKQGVRDEAKYVQIGIDELSVAPGQVLGLRKKIREIQ